MRVKIFFDARAQSANELVAQTNISKIETDCQIQSSQLTIFPHDE